MEIVKSGDIEYKIINGTAYHKETSDEVVRVLESARNNHTRIKLYYGDVETGRDWNELYDTTGTIGRSTGSIKIPLLIRTERSLGGGGILDHCIVKIKDTKTGRVLYQNPKYQAPVVEIVKSDLPEYEYNTVVNGETVGRHKTLRSAEMLKAKLMECGGCTMEAGGEITDARIETALRSYAYAGLWTTQNMDNEEEEHLDENYSVEDIAPDTMESMRRDVKKFYEENIDLLNQTSMDDARIGHNFWLNKNHHGSGFWDEEGVDREIGKKLSDASHKFKENLLVVGDDGKIHDDYKNEKGGRLKSAVARERKYTSGEKHELKYMANRKSPILQYQKHSSGGSMATGGGVKGGYKISYQKHWHPTEGTTYDQTVKIDKRTYDHLRDAVASEIAMGRPQKDKYVWTSGYEFYLKPLVLENGVVYLNHTQTRFINMFLKLPLKDRNTMLKVVDKLSLGGLLDSGDDGIYWLITG